MDSIGDNVMAIICVVVGVLIIGCALVPIVDKASVITIGEDVTEDRSGTNTLSVTDQYLLGYVESLTVTTDGAKLTVNGNEYTGPEFRAFPRIGDTYYARFYSTNITLMPGLTGSNQVTLANGTFTYSAGMITVTGPDDYTLSMEVSTLAINNAKELTDNPDTELYGRMTTPIDSCIIGEDQKFIYSNGLDVYTTDSTNLPSGVSITKNTNETFATVSFESGAWYGPYVWAGTVIISEQTEEQSEFASLYGMIPVLCILAMAYVLIRRFY